MAQKPIQTKKATVISVHDGDTVRVKLLDTGEETSVRLNLIDAPEDSNNVGTQSYGKEAGDYLRSLIQDKEVDLEIYGKDKYERTIAVIKKDGVDINARMIEEGLAWHYKKYDNTEHYAQYDSLEKEAKNLKKGLWSDPNATPPWEFRHKANSSNRPNYSERRRGAPSYNLSTLSASSKYIKTYTSYSGHDMVVIFEIPLIDGSFISKVIGMCQTISYSVHNEKMPVRVLGDMNMKSVVFGNRTIAGSMIFTVFDEHWSNELIAEYKNRIAKWRPTMLDDELPPINVTISMVNEYGDRSRLAIYGVTFVNEGQVMSINDTYTENTFQFYAKDIDYLTSDVNKKDGGKTNLQKETERKKIEELNSEDLPIDIPISAYKNMQESGVTKTLEKDKKRYDIYNIDYKNLSKGRDVFIKEMDKKYEDLISYFDRDVENGVISQEQCEEQKMKAKEIWLKRRTQADEYYAKETKKEASDE